MELIGLIFAAIFVVWMCYVAEKLKRIAKATETLAMRTPNPVDQWPKLPPGPPPTPKRNTEPKLVTCKCASCQGPIDFYDRDYDPLQKVPCPHCGAEIRLYIPTAL